MTDEKILMAQWNRGDPLAPRRIYEKYKHQLVTLAAALLFDKTAAEDVVHDLFARLLEKRQQIRITANLKSYLTCGVANGARNVNRRLAHSQARLDTAAADPPSTLPPPELFAWQQEENRKLAEALSRLPYEQREVILLRHYSGMKLKTIAALQETSINTAQGRYRYGMQKMRSFLNGEQES